MTFVPEYQVVLTRRCSYACGYCNFRSVASPLPPSRRQFKQWMRTALRLGAYQVRLTSGEGVDRIPEIVSICRFYGFPDWFEYVQALCQLVLEQQNGHRLQPQLDIGGIPCADLVRLRPVLSSARVMLHAADDSLQDRAAHMHAPQKTLRARLAALDELGKLGICTVTGITVGIGESRSSWALAARQAMKIHEVHGCVKCFEIRPFEPVRFSPMEKIVPPPEDVLLDAIREVRAVLHPDVVLSVALNDRPELLVPAVRAGANDIGGLLVGSSERINFDYQGRLDAMTVDARKARLKLIARPGFGTIVQGGGRGGSSTGSGRCGHVPPAEGSFAAC